MEIKKGYLVKVDNQRKITFDISLCDGGVCDDSKEFYDYFQTLTDGEQLTIENCLRNLDDKEIEDPKVIDLLFRFCKEKINGYNVSLPILYEEKIDEKGNKYGSEMKTGFAFPIPKTLTGNFKPVVKRNIKAFSSNDEKIFYYHGREMANFTVVFIDKKKKKYYTGTTESKKTYYSLYERKDDAPSLYTKPKYNIEPVDITRIRIRMSLDFIHDNVNRAEVFLIDNGYANDLEVTGYNNTGNREKIITLYRQNNFIDEHAANSNVKTKRNSDILTLMNNIEACLSIIKDINENLYIGLKDKYQDIIGANDVNKSKIENELQIFYNAIRSCSVFPSSSREAIVILDNYIIKTVNSINGNTYPNVYLPVLTKIHDDIIKKEDEYPLVDVKTLNERMNLLYFLYLYINKDMYNVTDPKLEESSFYRDINCSFISSNITGIINAIKVLIDNDLIERDAALIYHMGIFYKPNEVNLKGLLTFINDLKLKDPNKVKEYILK
jgi:hypothetical protein